MPHKMVWGHLRVIRQVSLLILSEFNWSNELLFPLKSSEIHLILEAKSGDGY